MVKMTGEYLAGMMTGGGLAMFFLALGVQSDVLKGDILVNSGIMFAGLALVLGGGGMKMRLQQAKALSEAED
jgi:hypothetical protein